MYDTTVNNEALTGRMLPVLERAADGRIRRSLPVGASEDFSFFAQEAPGLFVFLGVTPEGQDPGEGRAQPQPQLLRRRGRAGGRRPDDGLTGRQLSRHTVWKMTAVGHNEKNRDGSKH